MPLKHAKLMRMAIKLINLVECLHERRRKLGKQQNQWIWMEVANINSVESISVVSEICYGMKNFASCWLFSFGISLMVSLVSEITVVRMGTQGLWDAFSRLWCQKLARLPKSLSIFDENFDTPPIQPLGGKDETVSPQKSITNSE